jgi:two-component system response regulator
MRESLILLVEDNPDDVALTLRALKKNQIASEVAVASDGEDALNWLFATGPHANRDPRQPALVLLDLKIPKIDGLQVLKRLRADPRTALFPVVVLTTSKEQDDLITSYRNGANSYVRKPVDFNAFSEAVRQLGLYWLLLNEGPPNG